jgi:EmrB/QacA subfamily drug resistance transporter
MTQEITQSASHATPGRDGGRTRWLALFVVLLATFMDLIDVTIVGVALPRIQGDLHAGYSVGQWVVAGYALSYALLLVTGGRLGDIFGRRRTFMIGVAGFTLASALAGAAISPAMLIIARAAQGAFGGIMVPQVMSVVATQFAPGRERTLAFSLYGALLGVAQVSGPVLGGLLTTYDWRLIFYVNIPVGLFALAGAFRWMRESRSPRPVRLDLGGAALISGASLLLAFPLVQGRELGWPPWSIGLLLAAVPVLAVFIWYERGRGADALVPMRLFTRRSFTVGLILMIVLFSGISAYFITLTWALQFRFGWSPLHLALTSLAWPIGIACTAQLTQRYGHGYGRRLVGIGTTLMAAGTAALALVAAHDGAGATSAHIAPCLFLSGLGMGLTIPILSNQVLGDLPAEDAGAASGVLNSVVQLGAAFGVAVGGVIFFAQGASWSLAYGAAVFLLAALLSPLLPARPGDAGTLSSASISGQVVAQSPGPGSEVRQP